MRSEYRLGCRCTRERWNDFIFPFLFITLIGAPILSGIGVTRIGITRIGITRIGITSAGSVLFYISMSIQLVNLIGFIHLYNNFIVDTRAINLFLMFLFYFSVIVTIVLGALYNLPLLIGSCVIAAIALFWMTKGCLVSGIKYAYNNPKSILIGLSWASLIIMMIGSGLFFIVQHALGNKVELPGLLWAGSTALLLIVIILHYYRNLIHISAEGFSIDPKPIHYYNFMLIVYGLICLTGLTSLIVTLVLKIKWTLWYGIAIYGLLLLSPLIRCLMMKIIDSDESINKEDKIIGNLFSMFIPFISMVVSPALLIIAGTQLKMLAIFWSGIGIYCGFVGAGILFLLLYFLIYHFRSAITILSLLIINVSAVLCVVTKVYPSFPYPYLWIIGTTILSLEGLIIFIGSILYCFRDVFLIPKTSNEVSFNEVSSNEV